MSHLQPVPSASDDDVDAAVEVALTRAYDRHAEAALLDDSPDPAPLDALVLALRSVGELPDELAARHVAELVEASTSWGARSSTSWGARASTTWRPRRGTVRTVVGTGVLAATMLGGVSVAAASSALPGDTLYGLKTARERVVVALAQPGDERAAVHLGIARTRLAETTELLTRGRSDLGIKTLARADAALAAATAAGSDAIDDRADDQLANRVAVLTALLDGGLPEQAADAAREAIERAIAHETGRPEEPGNGNGNGNDNDNDNGNGNGGEGKPTTTPAGPANPAPGQSSRPTDKPAPGRGKPSADTDRPGGRPTSRATGRPAAG